MTIRLPAGKTRLLLVEGKEDQEFFIQLGAHMKLIDSWPLQINQVGGVSKLEDYLIALSNVGAFARIDLIGIVRDADFNTNAMQSVQSSIRNANDAGSRNKLPVPDEVMKWSKGRPSVGVMIMPSAEREGTLETLVMDAFQADPVTACVDAYFQCLRDTGASVKQCKLSKARLRAFVTGKNVSEEAEGDDSDKLYLSDVFGMSWWRKSNLWDHATFDQAKAFLTQLLAS